MKLNDELKTIAKNMRDLGLGALMHANRHAAYQDVANDKWAELSVLQAAHAAEILIKAKIAEEHPLLIFESFPKVTDTEISLEALFADGHTIEWSQLPSRLWATTGIHINNKDCFIYFGKLRNSIQHFGAVPKNISASLETLKFIYSVVDPFINQQWGLFAIDYDEDSESYVNFLPTLIYYEIDFLVSADAAKCHEYWDSDLENSSNEYKCKMKRRIEDALRIQTNLPAIKQEDLL